MITITHYSPPYKLKFLPPVPLQLLAARGDIGQGFLVRIEAVLGVGSHRPNLTAET